MFDSTATLAGRDSSNDHVKPSARQRGASVTRMEFNEPPVAIRIGAVSIMTMHLNKVLLLTCTFMIDDGLFVAARCVENKTIKDFQRCISLHKQLQQSSSSCKSQLVFFHPQSRAKKIKLSLSDKTRTIHPANNYK